MATGPLLSSPVILGRLDFLSDPCSLSSLLSHLIDRLFIIRRSNQRSILNDSLEEGGLLHLINMILRS